MKRLTILIAFLTSLANAGDIAPVTWYTASTQAVGVACYHAAQFAKMKVKEKYVLVIVPAASWAVKAKSDSVKSTASDMLTGKTEVTAKAMTDATAKTGDAEIKFVPTDDPMATLAKMGLAAPAMDDVFGKEKIRKEIR